MATIKEIQRTVGASASPGADNAMDVSDVWRHRSVNTGHHHACAGCGFRDRE